MLIRLITAPTKEPVSLREAKDHLRLDETKDDDRVLGLIATARQYLEKVCWRVLLSTTYEVALNGFSGEDRFELPTRRQVANTSGLIGFEWANTDRAYRFFPYLELPKGQLDETGGAGTSIVSFTYLDPSNVQQTVSSSVYELDTYSAPGRIRLKYGQTWPVALDHWNSVVIRYKVGWAGTKTDPVPEPLRQALLIHMAQLYEYRTTEVITRATPVPVGMSYDALIRPYRLNRF